MKLSVDQQAFLTLRKLGIQAIGIIEFDEVYGPMPKFIHSQHAKLVRRILQDQLFPMKLSVLSKYASEATLADDLKVIIETFRSSGDNRAKINFIVAQVSEEADYARVRALLRDISKRLSTTEKIDKESLERILREAL
ncbi:MAG: hypothetical protein QXH98_00765 [Candidatus Korarchaeota archaeon]